MVTIEEMEKAEHKIVNIYFMDGVVWENKKCGCFYNSQSDDEEHMLEVDPYYLINQSKIKKIEILD